MNADLAYIAGFIDGEGCFGIAKNGSVNLSIVNTYRETLEFVRGTLGVGVVRNRTQKVNKRLFSYHVYGDDCLIAIHQLLPFLREKRPQAQVILDFREAPSSIVVPGKRGRFRNKSRDIYRETIRDLKFVESPAICPSTGNHATYLLKTVRHD